MLEDYGTIVIECKEEIHRPFINKQSAMFKEHK